MTPIRDLPVPRREAKIALRRHRWTVAPSGGALPVRGRTVIRLWLPLTPLFALLAPLALAAAPLADLHPSGRRLKPIRSVWALGAILFSLSGTSIEVDRRDVHVSIRIL